MSLHPEQDGAQRGDKQGAHAIKSPQPGHGQALHGAATKGAHALESPHPEQGRALHEATEDDHALRRPSSLHGEVDEESTEVEYNKKYADGNSVKTNNKKGAHVLEGPHLEHGRALHGAKQRDHALKRPGALPGEVNEESTEVKYYKKYGEGDIIKTNNKEGVHALKSLLPEAKGGALHGAKEVWGGHALVGARPDEEDHQGVS